MIHDILKNRYSPRAFSDKKIENEKIISILEAARWAPSSSNEQPWRFIIAEKSDTDNHQKIVDVLSDGNKSWAKNAPLLILSITKLVSRNNKINRYAYYDIGTAAAHITFQASVLGLYVRQMGGFNPDKARVLFNIPEMFAPVSVIAVGYKGEVLNLPENYRDRETAVRTRKNLDEIVFTNSFGESSSLLKENIKIK